MVTTRLQIVWEAAGLCIVNMTFSLNFISFFISFTTRRSFQPGWQSQNCFCSNTVLMRGYACHLKFDCFRLIQHFSSFSHEKLFDCPLLHAWRLHKRMTKQRTLRICPYDQAQSFRSGKNSCKFIGVSQQTPMITTCSCLHHL